MEDKTLNNFKVLLWWQSSYGKLDSNTLSKYENKELTNLDFEIQVSQIWKH